MTIITNAWYPVGLSEDFGRGELRDLNVASRPIVAWRDEDSGVVNAFQGQCPHKSFPLAKGKIKDGTLECGYHGLRFACTGVCVYVPSLDQPDGGKIPSRANLRRFSTAEQDGLVWLWPGESERAERVIPPRTPELADPDWLTAASPWLTVAANVRLTIENLLDITHFYPLHSATIGNIENSSIPFDVVSEEQEDKGVLSLTTVRTVSNYPLPPMLQGSYGLDVVDRVHSHSLLGVSLVRAERRNAAPGMLGTEAERGQILFHLLVPLDENTHQWKWVVACRSEYRDKLNPGRSFADRLAQDIKKVIEEDRYAIEEQQRMLSHSDPDYVEVTIKSDRAVLEGRRLLEKYAAQE